MTPRQFRDAVERRLLVERDQRALEPIEAGRIRQTERNAYVRDRILDVHRQFPLFTARQVAEVVECSHVTVRKVLRDAGEYVAPTQAGGTWHVEPR